MFCLNCKTFTENPKFCTRSCFVSYNNKKSNGRRIGRKKQHVKLCKVCGTDIFWNQTRCPECKFFIKANDGKWYAPHLINKAQILTNDTQAYRRIRSHARNIANAHGLLAKCVICDYALHVECCHINSIESFADDAKLIEINDPKNLIGMCRNHHWEYDHGYLKDWVSTDSNTNRLPLDQRSSRFQG